MKFKAPRNEMFPLSFPCAAYMVFGTLGISLRQGICLPHPGTRSIGSDRSLLDPSSIFHFPYRTNNEKENMDSVYKKQKF